MSHKEATKNVQLKVRVVFWQGVPNEETTWAEDDFLVDVTVLDRMEYESFIAMEHIESGLITILPTNNINSIIISEVVELSE